ncbi:PD40 domain-containing protein [Streptomyces thioluteus]|uniref:PD40 domain-containing protein n=1 Tax=Streptomyces thioluteus TaxID=66431 RepID=A0ABN3WD79_STRTU
MTRRPLAVTAALTATLLATAAPTQAAPAAKATAKTTRASTATDGTPANGTSRSPSPSADGRYVAFSSDATNLVPGDTDQRADVFVKDLRTGRIVRVTAPEHGPGIKAAATEPSLSADGRRVAFRSLVEDWSRPGHPPVRTSHVHVTDLRTGRTEQVDVGLGGEDGRFSGFPVIGPDGRSVMFTSGSSYVEIADHISNARLYERDLVRKASTLIASSPRHVAVTHGSTSRDHRRVAYEDLSMGVSGRPTSEIHLLDRRTGEDRRLDLPHDGGQDHQSAHNPSVSADGRYVQFTSAAPNLLPGGERNRPYVYLYDTRTGKLRRAAEEPASKAEFSGDGQRLAYEGRQVRLRDLRSGRTWDVSVTPEGAPSAKGGREPVPDAHGDAVAFTSFSPDLVPGKAPDVGHIYLRRLR